MASSTDPLRGVYEREAKVFAAELLMPLAEVRRVWMQTPPQMNDDPSPSEGKLLFRVRRLLNGEKRAVIVNAEGAKGEEKTIAVSDLLAVKRFGEPMYAALTPLGDPSPRAKDRPHHAVISGENFHTLQRFAYLYVRFGTRGSEGGGT